MVCTLVTAIKFVVACDTQQGEELNLLLRVTRNKAKDCEYRKISYDWIKKLFLKIK